jgi:hypothetical protein
MRWHVISTSCWTSPGYGIIAQTDCRWKVARLVSGVTASVAIIEPCGGGRRRCHAGASRTAKTRGSLGQASAGSSACSREHFARTFGLAHAFVDIDNPV